jgi:hypothetical protein
MSKAGSALMGIGRATGENRAVAAAQQAIESPLLEVSIDGARGILFNVIGGNDLAMHEINAAAEAITSAADPEANIIFGATIDPKLEGEVIITVVATGFDASYYGDRPRKPATTAAKAAPGGGPQLANTNATKQDEKALAEIDMSLDDDHPDTADFTDHRPMPNIWAINGEEESEEDSKDKPEHEVVTSDIEEELEKPSFLRRLGRRRHKDEEAPKPPSPRDIEDETDEPAKTEPAESEAEKSEKTEADKPAESTADKDES